MNIAKTLQERLSDEPGTIIEFGYRSDSIDVKIAKTIGEQLSFMQWYLLEVTAIGEEAILAFVLTGSGGGENMGYGAWTWERQATEMIFRGGSVLNVVGHRNASGIEWVDPNQENIYAKGQQLP